MDSEKLVKIYVIENKIVSLFWVARQRRNAGGKMKVCSIMLLKTNVEKMSVLWLSIMLMKIHEL